MSEHVSITIPTDGSGYFARECPECEGTFKVTPGTGLPDADHPFCPYCGHQGPNDTFWTKEQIEYAESVALNHMTGRIMQMMKRHEFDIKPKGAFGIGVSLKVTGSPTPIRLYVEPELQTDIVCDQCTLRYAIYGAFAFCPDCGTHNSLQILHKNLEFVEKLLSLQVDRDTHERLTHDALENAVSAFDAFGREACRLLSLRLTVHDKWVPSFQSLATAAEHVLRIYGTDLKSVVSASDWTSLIAAFQKRHLIAHKLGVIDQKYVDVTQDPTAVVGRSVTVTVDEVRQVCASLLNIGQSLSDALR